VADRRAWRRAGPWVAALLLTGCASGSHTAVASPTARRTATASRAVGVGHGAAVSMPTGPAAHFRVARRTAAGPVMLTWLTGARSGVTGKVWVWLPPQYHDHRYARTGFPVITLYTGGTGAGYNYWSNPQVIPAQEDDVRLVEQGRAHPFIMVMPILQPSVREDTECSDLPGHPKMGTWLAEDVPAFIRANFRTLTSRDGWGTAGASSGAFCAVKMAADQPGRYKAAVSWGGYFAPETDLSWSAEGQRANSPDLVLQRTRPDIRLLLLAGGDPQVRRDVQRMNALVKVLSPPTVASTYIQPNGAHRTVDLRKLVPRILEFLTRNMAGPTSGGNAR
jgi:enterochelin esterase-like enzyme